MEGSDGGWRVTKPQGETTSWIHGQQRIPSPMRTPPHAASTATLGYGFLAQDHGIEDRGSGAGRVPSTRVNDMQVEVLLDSPARSSFTTRRAMFEAAASSYRPSAALSAPAHTHAAPTPSSTRRVPSSETPVRGILRHTASRPEDTPSREASRSRPSSPFASAEEDQASKAKLEALEKKVAVMLNELSETKRRQKLQEDTMMHAKSIRRPGSARKPSLGGFAEEEEEEDEDKQVAKSELRESPSSGSSSVLFSTPMSSAISTMRTPATMATVMTTALTATKSPSWGVHPRELWYSAESRGPVAAPHAHPRVDWVPAKSLDTVSGTLLASRAFSWWRGEAERTQRSILSRELEAACTTILQGGLRSPGEMLDRSILSPDAKRRVRDSLSPEKRPKQQQRDDQVLLGGGVDDLAGELQRELEIERGRVREMEEAIAALRGENEKMYKDKDVLERCLEAAGEKLVAVMEEKETMAAALKEARRLREEEIDDVKKRATADALLTWEGEVSPSKGRVEVRDMFRDVEAETRILVLEKELASAVSLGTRQHAEIEAMRSQLLRIGSSGSDGEQVSGWRVGEGFAVIGRVSGRSCMLHRFGAWKRVVRARRKVERLRRGRELWEVASAFNILRRNAIMEKLSSERTEAQALLVISASEHDEAKRRVSELEDENQSLNKSLEERNNESAEGSGAGASESLAIQELEDELAGAKRALEEQSRHHREVVVDLKQRLDASPLQPVSSPQRPAQSPQHSEHELRKQYADLVSQHAELVFELGVEKDMGAKRAVRIEWLDSENERLRVELETAVALKNERAASAEGLRAENERLGRDLAAKEGSASGYVALRQERDTLFAEVERLRAAAAHLDVAKAENGELKESIGILEGKVEERMRENMKILEEVEGLRSSERAMVVLGQENSQLREIKGELEKEIGGMRAVAGAAVVIEKERDELKKQVAYLQEEMNRFEVSRKEHEDNKAVLSTSIKSNHQLSQANSELLGQVEGLEVQLSAAKVALSAFSSDEQRRNEKIVASERRLSEIQELTENLLLRSDAARERMAAYINKGRVSRLHFDVLRLWQRHAWLVKRVHLAREKRSDRLLRRAFGELSIQGWMDQSFQYMQHLENDVSSTVADLVESKRTRATEIADLQTKHSSEISRLETEMHARRSSEVASMEMELRELRNQRAREIWEMEKLVSALEAPAAMIDDCVSTVSVCVKSSLKEVVDALEGQVGASEAAAARVGAITLELEETKLALEQVIGELGDLKIEKERTEMELKETTQHNVELRIKVVKLEGICQESSAQHQRIDTDMSCALSGLVEDIEATIQGTEAVMSLIVTGVNIKEMSVSGLQSEVARLGEARACAKEEACLLENRLVEMEDRCNNLSKMLGEADGNMTQMAARLESAELEVADMKEALAVSAVEEKNAREAMEKMQGIIAQNLAEIESSKATVDALREKENDMAAMIERVEVAEGESKRLSAALKVMRQNEDKFGPIVVSIKEKLASAETEVKHLTDAMLRMRESENKLKVAAQKGEKASKDLEDAESKIKIMSEAMDRHTALSCAQVEELEGMRGRLEESQAACRALESRLADQAQSHKLKIDGALEKFRALSAEAKDAAGSHQEQVAALLTRTEEVQAELEGEKRGAERRRGELEGQIRGLLERNAVLEAARERSVELEGRVADADTGVLKLTEACEKLKAQLRETTASLLRAGEEKFALEGRLKAAEESLNAAQRELDMSVEAIRELQQERQRLGEERDETRLEMLAKLEEANDENLRLVSGNNELRELAGEAESEIASLREQCQSLDETCREALGEGAMARAELELARADSARANKQVEVLKDELANAEEEIRLLAASVGAKEQEKCRLTEGNEEEMRRFAESVEELYALYEAVKDDHVGVKDKVEGAYEETQRKLLDTDGACKKLQQKLREAEGAYEEAQQKIRTKERLCVESQRKLCQTEENLQTLMVDLESVKVELDIVRTKLEDESQENMSKEFTIGGANGKNDIHSSGAVGGKIADTLTPDSEAMGRLKQELEESRAEARRLALSLDTLTARARLESVEKDLELLSPSKSKGSSASSTPSKSNSSPTKSLAKAPSMPSSRESSASPSPTKAPAAKALTVMRDFAIEACVEVDRSTAVCKVFASDGEAYRSEISQSSRRLQDIIQEVGLVLDQVDGRAVETVTSLKGKHNKEVLSLKSALAEVRKEVESLKGELNAAADERKELLLQFDEERSRAVSPKEDAVEPVNSLGEAEKLASESLKRADAADEERRCVAERLETVTLELQRANDACRTLAEQLHEANTRLNAADEGKERIDVLTSELVEVKAVLDAARDRNTELEGQIRGLLERNAVLEAARERSVEEKDATIKALEDEVERVAAEKEAADVAVKKAMKDVEEIRGEFAEALRRASDLESQLQQAKVHSKKAHVQESALEKAQSEQVGQEQAHNEEETLEKAHTTSLDEAIKQVLDLEKALEEANVVIQELKSKVTSLEAARARDEEYTAVEVTSLIKALEERGLDLEKASSCEAELRVKIAELEAALEGRQGKLERLERHVTDLLDSEDALEEQCRSLQAEGKELRLALEESYAAFDELQRGKGALAEEALSQSKGVHTSIEEMQLRDEAELLTSSFSSQRAGSSSLSPVQVETSPSSRNTRHSSVSGGISPSPNPSQNPAQPSTASAAVPRGGFLEPAPNTLRIEDLGTSEQGGRHDSARGGLSSSSHAPILRRGAKPLDGSGSVLKMVASIEMRSGKPSQWHPEPSTPRGGPTGNSKHIPTARDERAAGYLFAVRSKWWASRCLQEWRLAAVLSSTRRSTILVDVKSKTGNSSRALASCFRAWRWRSGLIGVVARCRGRSNLVSLARSFAAWARYRCTARVRRHVSLILRRWLRARRAGSALSEWATQARHEAQQRKTTEGDKIAKQRRMAVLSRLVARRNMRVARRILNSLLDSARKARSLQTSAARVTQRARKYLLCIALHEWREETWSNKRVVVHAGAWKSRLCKSVVRAWAWVYISRRLSEVKAIAKCISGWKLVRGREEGCRRILKRAERGRCALAFNVWGCGSRARTIARASAASSSSTGGRSRRLYSASLLLASPSSANCTPSSTPPPRTSKAGATVYVSSQLSGTPPCTPPRTRQSTRGEITPGPRSSHEKNTLRPPSRPGRSPFGEMRREEFLGAPPPRPLEIEEVTVTPISAGSMRGLEVGVPAVMQQYEEIVWTPGKTAEEVGKHILDEIEAWKEDEEEVGEGAIRRLQAAKLQRQALIQALAWDGAA